jgi:hypothetical protein
MLDVYNSQKTFQRDEEQFSANSPGERMDGASPDFNILKMSSDFWAGPGSLRGEKDNS